MAAVTMDTVELETLVQRALTDSNVGMQVLNLFRVKNGKQAHPANFGPGDLSSRPEDATWRAALAGLTGDLA